MFTRKVFSEEGFVKKVQIGWFNKGLGQKVQIGWFNKGLGQKVQFTKGKDLIKRFSKGELFKKRLR